MKNRKLTDDVSKKESFERFNILLSFFAIVVSIISLWVTYDTSKTLLEYQIEQERLPRVVALDQELSILFFTMEYDDVVDFSSFRDDKHVIEIPVYNIGVGTAQNCTLEWEYESIKSAYHQLIGLLEEKDSTLINEFSFFDDGSFISNYDTYNFEMEDGELNSLFYKDSTNGSHIREVLYTEPLRYPYMLPIIDSTSDTYISLPEALSTILIEAANQEVDEEISIDLHVKYEDISSKEYEQILRLTFSLDKRVELESQINCIYLISVEEIK